MKIRTHTNRKKKILIVSLIAVLLTVGGVFAYMQSPLYTPAVQTDEERGGVDDENGINDNENQDAQNEDGHLPDPTDNADREPSEEQPSQPSNPERSSAQIHIPNYQAENGVITVNMIISEVWGSGRCVVRVEGPRSETASMDVFPQAQNSGCGPSVANLPSGNYTVSAYAERDGRRTNVETLNVNL